MIKNNWNLTESIKPQLGDEVEFSNDGVNCDYGLICDDPKYWRLIE